MPIIKLDATGSTNDFLRDLLKETKLDDYTVVWADYQHSGRGQRENTWQSEKGKNLIVSILKLHSKRSARSQFEVNRAVSLALVQSLSDLNIPDLAIKWPNDILSGDRKMCGILIENVIKGSRLKHSIIGIGLNVNQRHFEDLPHASSLAMIKDESYDRDILLYQLLARIKTELSIVSQEDLEAQKKRYEALLYRRGQKVTFEDRSGTFEAIVKGVTEAGELQLVKETGELERYAKGAIRWIATRN